MGCAGCKKRREASAKIYITCPVCGTDLHGKKKTMPRINGTLVCGQCYKKYKAIKKLEEVKKDGKNND